LLGREEARQDGRTARRTYQRPHRGCGRECRRWSRTSRECLRRRTGLGGVNEQLEVAIVGSDIPWMVMKVVSIVAGGLASWAGELRGATCYRKTRLCLNRCSPDMSNLIIRSGTAAEEEAVVRKWSSWVERRYGSVRRAGGGSGRAEVSDRTARRKDSGFCSSAVLARARESGGRRRTAIYESGASDDVIGLSREGSAQVEKRSGRGVFAFAGGGGQSRQRKDAWR
jgi:hypothetical protein